MARVFIVMLNDGTPYAVFSSKKDSKKKVENLLNLGIKSYSIAFDVIAPSEHNEIRKVFLEWDPINVRDSSIEEYDTYVSKVYQTLEFRDAGAISAEEAMREIESYIVQAELDMFSGNYSNPTRKNLVDKLCALSTKEMSA